MRLRFGLSLPEKGGRPSLVAAEVIQDVRTADPTRKWNFEVGLVDRVPANTIEAAVSRTRDIVTSVTDHEPCVFVDVGTPQGLAARRSLRKGWPESLHRPHAYERTKFDTATFAAFLEAYADGRVTFLEGLSYRRDLDRALVLFRGGGVEKAGDELASEDEAMVNALCLALSFPTHGSEARRLEPPPPAPVPRTSVIMGTLEV